MKRIILSFFVLMMITVGASAQNYTYLLNHVVDGGNPGGIYTDTDASTTGWTEVIAPTAAANSWSDTVGIPFPFHFYGTPVTHFKVSGNGVMTFDTSVTTATGVPSDINTNLPAPAGANIPNNSILGFWDSFSASAPLGTNDRVWTKTFGTAPNRQTWIQYFSYEYGSNGSSQISSFAYWAIGIEEGTNKVYVLDKNYHSSGNLLTTTIGVQKNSTVAVQFADSLVGMASGGTAITDNDYYEFTPLLLVNNNAGITSIDAPFAPLMGGLQNVDVTLKNHGQNALTSATINWSVNGVIQAPYAWTGNLASQVSTASSVTVGQYNFGAGNFVVSAWTSMPNGAADAATSDDSSSVELCTPLAGTFTVGGAGANYANVQAALDAIINCGISGPITFNIAPGTYNNSFTIPEVIGMSATNTVTFNGAGMGSTTLSYDGSGTQNATILFDGGDYFTFKNMKIERALGGSYNWGVRMQNSSNYNTFDSCTIEVDVTTTSSLYIPFLMSGSATSSANYADNANYTTISNCVVSGGYYGIRMNGTNSTGSYANYNRVMNTTVQDQYYYGIMVYYQDSVTLIGNTIEENRQATSGYGMYLYYGSHTNVQKNLIKGAKTYGIYCYQQNSTTTGATGRGYLINNMVTAKSAGDALYCSLTQDMDVFHNSFYTEDDQAIYFSGSADGMDFRNNILYTKNEKVVEFTTALPNTATFDYNLLYRETAGDLAKDGSFTATDLAAWQLAQPAKNANSKQGDPVFVDALNGDLHVFVGPGLISGDNTVGVMEDFDGDARPWSPTTIVDIGADEIFVQNLDAGIVSFDSPLPPVPAGLKPIQVSLKNNGATALTAVTINWAANGVVQTPFAWTGNLSIGQEANAVTIGNFNILTGFTQFDIWTSAPNGGVDGDSSNDTLVYDLCTPLSGTVNVGGPTPKFSTIAAAANAIAFCGVGGPVTVNIAPGVYTEPILIEEAPGASAANRITFDGVHKDSVWLTYAAGTVDQNATILFNGGDYYTFKNMTIENTGTSYAWGVRFQNDARHNKLDGNIIMVDTTATSSLYIPVLASGSSTSTASYGSNAHNTTISNNEIRGGYYGVRLSGGSGTEADMNASNVIEGNHFSNQYYYGIYAYYQKDLEIKNNIFETFRVSSSGYGMLVGYAMLPEITGNWVKDAKTYGIYMFQVNQYATSKRGLIANNMVKASVSGDGFYVNNIEQTDFFHNTAYAENDQAFYATTNVNNISLKNNIFISETQSAVDFTSNIDISNVIDYNVYYRTDGGNLIEDGTTNHADLVAWKTASPLLNINSLVGDPLFLNAANGDLHLIGAVANDNGDNTVGVNTDIDGDTRPISPSVTVDIGADEYTPLLNDMELVEIFVKPNSCNLPSDSVWAVVRSLGLAPVTSLNVSTVVTGAVSTTLNSPVSTNLTLGFSDTIYVGSFNSSNGGIFNIMASLAYTNDQNTSNDTSGMIMVQRMSAPTATVTDVACLGDNTGSIALNFVGTGTIATVDETINQALAANLTYNFLGAQGISGITLEIEGYGDIDGSGTNLEAYDIYDENGTFVTQYGATGVQCGTSPVSIVSIPDATYATWAADGVVTFTAVATSAVNVTLCGGGNDWLEIKLAGNGTPTLLWSNGDTTEVVDGLAPGTYSVTATDLLGCIQSASFTVGSATNPKPSLTINTVNDVSCNGANDGSIDVTGAGGTGSLTYNWSNNATTQDLSNLGAGMYNVVISDANGCTDSSATPIMITEPDSLSGTISYSVVGCDEVNIVASMTGGTMPYGFSWNNSSIDTSIQVNSGTYNLTVTDANGCVETKTITTTLPTELAISAMATASDTAGAGVGAATVTPTDGTAPYTYLWSNGATTATASALTGGNYTVTVTDANGCSKTETVTVPFPTSANNWSVVSSIEMFPNPTNGLVTFNITMKSTADLTITIFNVAGQEMTSFTNSNANQVMRKYDTSLLADGVYMVRFVAGDDVVTKRLVVRK